MKLISLNIEVNKNYDTVLNFLKKEKADVVCLQEILEIDFNRFEKELNLEGIYKPFKYSNSSYYQDVIGKRHGIAIFAKNIISHGYNFYEGKEENALKSFEEYLSKESNDKNSVLLWSDIKNDKGELFKFITTHLPKTHEGVSSPYQLEVLSALLKFLDPIPEFILCGDMNAPRGNETFRRLAEKYKDNIPLEYQTSIDQKLHKVKGIKFMVDCLFTTPQYKALNVKLVDGVSDHMAIVALIEKDL
jgi:exonuclease III